MRYEVVAVDIDGGEDQTGHEDNQAKRQAAKAVKGRLFGPERQDQLIFILENTHRQKKGLWRQLQSNRVQLSAYSSTLWRAAENDLN